MKKPNLCRLCGKECGGTIIQSAATSVSDDSFAHFRSLRNICYGCTIAIISRALQKSEEKKIK